MGKTVPPPENRPPPGPAGDWTELVPRPTAPFRQRAWVAFQRALDPLAPPRQLRVPRASLSRLPRQH
ncbi:MAG TPA: hypothetical protein VLB86_16700 [Gaiellaceae bacterium]|nr:hypothetical protein [Gaiellaceae bacterium]